ncbi:class I SAM-dependent methyltransferase, partial [Candidatus Symbiopectobacterium sp. NZEC135]
RVVVIDPDNAPTLAGIPAQWMVTTKSHRFDFYLAL